MQKYFLTKRENSRLNSLRKKGLVIVVGGLLIVLAVFLVPKLVKGAVDAFWLPFDRVRVWIDNSSDSLPSYLRDRQDLVTEIQSLKSSLAGNQGNENTLNKLQFENEKLRALVGEVPKERILARVIARPNQLPYDLLMLDRGSEDGVAVNLPVYLGRDQLIGIVTQVKAKTAFVTLITTAGFKVTAYVIGPNIYTEAQGMGGGVMRVRVPQGIALNENNLVILPAVAVTGVLGPVSSVVNSPTQPEQYGYITLPIALQSLQYVSIGTEVIVTPNFEQAKAEVDLKIQSLLQIDLPPGVLVTPETATSSISTSTTLINNQASTSNQE